MTQQEIRYPAQEETLDTKASVRPPDMATFLCETHASVEFDDVSHRQGCTNRRDCGLTEHCGIKGIWDLKISSEDLGLILQHVEHLTSFDYIDRYYSSIERYLDGTLSANPSTEQSRDSFLGQPRRLPGQRMCLVTRPSFSTEE